MDFSLVMFMTYLSFTIRLKFYFSLLFIRAVISYLKNHVPRHAIIIISTPIYVLHWFFDICIYDGKKWVGRDKLFRNMTYRIWIVRVHEPHRKNVEKQKVSKKYDEQFDPLYDMTNHFCYLISFFSNGNHFWNVQ